MKSATEKHHTIAASSGLVTMLPWVNYRDNVPLGQFQDPRTTTSIEGGEREFN
jgi:hypothetical protein